MHPLTLHRSLAASPALRTMPAPRPKAGRTARPPLTHLREHHAKALAAALRAVEAAGTVDKPAVLREAATILEMPHDALASRLIDLAPLDSRYRLRAQLLPHRPY